MPNHFKIDAENRLEFSDEILGGLLHDNKQGLSIGKSLNNDIVIRLHNQMKRPTTYICEIKSDKYGNISGAMIDTIINEMKGQHQSLKVYFSKKEVSHIINILNRLTSQISTGSPEETSANYVPLGLLMMKK